MSIGREDAIARARAVALERGWPWREPVRVHREFAFVLFGRMRWVVETNAEHRGANVRVVVDAEDGEIVLAAYLPR